MKKSIPVSHDLAEYFTNPCPALSDNNSQAMLDEIGKGYEWIVEYGTGASTVYFLEAASRHSSTMITVENNFDWFQICIEEVQKKLNFSNIDYSTKRWSLKDLNAFIKGKAATDAPKEHLEFSHWREQMTMGPFFRLSPNSSSRFSGKLGPLWPALKPVFIIFARILFLMNPERRLQKSEWRGRSGNFELIIRNIGPSIKDQFGEAPNMMDYIDAGLKEIREELKTGKTVTALFTIDGGPRHKIVREILALEDQYKNFKPSIMLCDAWRIFYHPTLAQRPSATFLAGTGRTLKGDIVEAGMTGERAKFWVGGDKTGQEMAQQEVWFYRNEVR